MFNSDNNNRKESEVKFCVRKFQPNSNGCLLYCMKLAWNEQLLNIKPSRFEISLSLDEAVRCEIILLVGLNCTPLKYCRTIRCV